MKVKYIKSGRSNEYQEIFEGDRDWLLGKTQGELEEEVNIIGRCLDKIYDNEIIREKI